MWDVSSRLLGDQKLLEQLMANPEALEYVLRQSPEFLDGLALYKLSPENLVRLIGGECGPHCYTITGSRSAGRNLRRFADFSGLRFNFNTGHAWRGSHRSGTDLNATGLSWDTIEAAIANDVSTLISRGYPLASTMQVRIDSYTIEYATYVLQDGTISISTYYLIK